MKRRTTLSSKKKRFWAVQHISKMVAGRMSKRHQPADAPSIRRIVGSNGVIVTIVNRERLNEATGGAKKVITRRKEDERGRESAN